MKVKGAKSGALFPAISGMERLPRSDKAEAKAPKYKEGIKVRCGDGDEIRKVILDKAVFDHTKSAFSKQFANMSTDDFIEAVLKEVNNVKEFAPGISSTPTSRTSSPGTPTNQQSSSGSSASMTGDVFSFDEGDTAVPEETPKKKSKSSSTSPENGKSSSSPPENGKPSSSPPENGKPSSSPPDNEKSSSSPPDNEKSSSSPPDDSADDSDAGSDNSDEDDESEEEVSEIESVGGGEGEAEVAESISDDQGPERDPESNDTGGSLTQLDDAQRQETEDDDALDGQ